MKIKMEKTDRKVGRQYVWSVVVDGVAWGTFIPASYTTGYILRDVTNKPVLRRARVKVKKGMATAMESVVAPKIDDMFQVAKAAIRDGHLFNPETALERERKRKEENAQSQRQIDLQYQLEKDAKPMLALLRRFEARSFHISPRDMPEMKRILERHRETEL